MVARSRAGASFSMIGVCNTRPVKYVSGATIVGTLPQAMIFIVGNLDLVVDPRQQPPRPAGGTFLRYQASRNSG
jgi:hypothetical protein